MPRRTAAPGRRSRTRRLSRRAEAANACEQNPERRWPPDSYPASVLGPFGHKWRTRMRMAKTILAAGMLAAITALPAAAADISGAGATFPYPIYAKWGDAYKKETGIGINYQS